MENEYIGRHRMNYGRLTTSSELDHFGPTTSPNEIHQQIEQWIKGYYDSNDGPQHAAS